MKTVKVRIAVAVDSNGNWMGAGQGDNGSSRKYSNDYEIGYRSAIEAQLDAGVPSSFFFLEAELPIPDETIPVIQAEVGKV